MASAYYSFVGSHMNRSQALSFFPVLLLGVLSLSSCSGLPRTIGGGGTATVLLTLVSDTPPASPSLLSLLRPARPLLLLQIRLRSSNSCASRAIQLSSPPCSMCLAAPTTASRFHLEALKSLFSTTPASRLPMLLLLPALALSEPSAQ